MPASDLLKEWQRAEAACVAAYQSMYTKVRSGAVVRADELEHLARLSREARESYRRYLEQVTVGKPSRPD